MLWEDFSTNQYIWGFVDGSISLYDKREYLCLDSSMETPGRF